MGHGIAQLFAMAGYETVLSDQEPKQLDTALERIAQNLAGAVEREKISSEDAGAAKERISVTSEGAALASDGADLVVEAIVEDLEAKRSVFAEIEEAVSETSILASNTSSLSIGAIAQAVKHSGRLLGMHFFNPVHIMKLLEIVRHEGTEPTTVDRVREIAVQLGKEPIVVTDTPGFASSRLGVVLGLEAMRMLEQGVASPEDIDTAMELGYGHPMGPLKVSDLVGLDVRLAIAEYLYREIGGDQYRPPDILKQKVENGELGKKSGKGFHEWNR